MPPTYATTTDWLNQIRIFIFLFIQWPATAKRAQRRKARNSAKSPFMYNFLNITFNTSRTTLCTSSPFHYINSKKIITYKVYDDQRRRARWMMKNWKKVKSREGEKEKKNEKEKNHSYKFLSGSIKILS